MCCFLLQIGKGEKLADILASMSEVAEGVPTILAGVKLAQRLGLQLPLLEAIHAMVSYQIKIVALIEREEWVWQIVDSLLFVATTMCVCEYAMSKLKIDEFG